MKIYDLATDVAKAVQERHIVKNAGAMTLHEKELRLANYQSIITQKLAVFLDEATEAANRVSNIKEIEEIEALRSSLMDSVNFDDIMRPAQLFV